MSAPVIDTSFPAGNAIIESVDGQNVYLRQDIRDTFTDWFYWSFRVRGAAGTRLTFHFTGTKVIGSRGPAIRKATDSSWYWDDRFGPDDTSFDHEFGPDDDEVYFSFAPHYTEANLHQFLHQHAANPRLHVGELLRTPQNRSVELLTIGSTDQPAHRVFVTGRHHACESMASFVLEGFLGEILSQSETGAWYANNVELIAVPFVDKDGVENGDQGKNRSPHDHNRDYNGESVYPTVAAIRALGEQWTDGRWHAALDFHCPARHGVTHERIHFVEPLTNDSQDMWGAISAFSEHVAQENTSGLTYLPDENLKFGDLWNVPDQVQSTCVQWAAGFPGVQLATILEFPYATIHGAEVHPDNARVFGQGIARALRTFLHGLPV